MAKSKDKKKLVTLDLVPSAKALKTEIKGCQERVAKVRTAISKDGKYSKYDPKYRQAVKRLKRSHRRLHKQRVRFTRPGQPLSIAAPAAPAAPAAEAPKAEEQKA